MTDRAAGINAFVVRDRAAAARRWAQPGAGTPRAAGSLVERRQVFVARKPQPLAVGGQSFFEPHVLPAGKAYAVAKPLVGKFVRNDILVGGSVCGAVGRQRRRLLSHHEAADVGLGIGNQHAIGVVGIGAKHA